MTLLLKLFGIFGHQGTKRITCPNCGQLWRQMTTQKCLIIDLREWSWFDRVPRLFEKKGTVLKAELSEKALKLVGNPNVLINLVSRRVRQLNSGGNRPLIMETAGLSTADIALTEIIEGKMSWESDLPTPKKKTRRRTRKA